MLVVENQRTAQTLELDIDVDSLAPQDSGSKEAGYIEFDLYDTTLAFDLLPEDQITVSKVASAALVFTGFIRSLKDDISATGRIYHVIAYDTSTMLDRINVVSDSRPAHESDATRLAYFMTTYGWWAFDTDPAGISVLRADMPAQKFRLLTLRQAIEQVLGTALPTATYRINANNKLDTWDSNPGLTPAPYNVVVGTPGAGEMAPENLVITADTSNLYNAYWVRGATAAGSGWQTDAASIAAWGRREKYIDAPDADLAWKAYNVGQAALADTAQPKYRGTFTAKDPFVGWLSNQRFALTSPQHNLVAAPFDTVRVTPRYLAGTALEQFDVEFGSPKASFAAKHGKNARRSDGTGPGSGGWGPGGGFGGATDVRPGGCCPEACSTVAIDTFDRTETIQWGTADSGQVWQENGPNANRPLTKTVTPGEAKYAAANWSGTGLPTPGVMELPLAGPPVISDANRFAAYWEAKIVTAVDDINWQLAASTFNLFIKYQQIGTRFTVAGDLNANITASGAITITSPFAVRVEVSGTRIKIKVWNLSTPEPGWQVDSAYTQTSAYTGKFTVGASATHGAGAGAVDVRMFYAQIDADCPLSPVRRTPFT